MPEASQSSVLRETGGDDFSRRLCACPKVFPLFPPKPILNMASHLDTSLASHTLYGMKMTMHIDETLLKRVMDCYDCTSKTETVDFALKELDRLHRLRAFAENGLGFTSDELKNAVDPDYDVIATRSSESLKVSEDQTPYEQGNSDR